MNEREKRELALSKILILILVVVGLLVVIWLAWFHPLPLRSSIASFEECTKAGYRVQQTYPETCVTKDGKRFTSQTEHRLLRIKEWQVQFPYPDNVRSLSYLLDNSDPSLAFLRLDDVPGSCKGTNQLRRAMSGGNLDGKGTTPEAVQAVNSEAVKRVGDYYYSFTQDPMSCTQDGQDRLLEQINTLSTGLQGASIQKLQVLQ